jgi:hypothetical protein
MYRYFKINAFNAKNIWEMTLIIKPILKILLGLTSAANFAAAYSQMPLQSIEIKGIYAGMPIEEYDKLFPNGLNAMTLAGVKPKENPRAIFRTDERRETLANFYFHFDPSDFEQIKSTVASKYPKLKCFK